MSKNRRSPWQGTVVPVKRKGVIIAFQARVPYVDDLGATRQKSVNKPTKREAERERARLVNERDARGLTKPERRTLAEEARHWLDVVKPNKIKDTSLHTYRQKMERYVIPYLGHLALRELRRHHFETWQRRLQDAGLSNSMINGVSDMVVHMLERLVPELWSVNPARIERLRKIKPKRVALSPEQVEAVIAAAPPVWFQLFLTILFWTGVRSGELAAVQLFNVFEDDPVFPYLKVVGTRYELSHERGVHAPKTEASFRIVPLLPPAADAFRAMRRQHIDNLHSFGITWNPEQYVFLTTKTQRLYGHSQLYMAWRTALKKAGLPSLPFHTTRHTTATLLLAA